MADEQLFGRVYGSNPSRETPRETEDDFHCLRFNVQYPSLDCAYRTKFKTCGGCLNCDQGRFNLRRHAQALLNVRPPTFHDD